MVELVRILNSIPAAEAIRTLRLLSTETNAPIILSTLRDEARTRRESSGDSSMAAMSNDTFEPLEFEVQNPIAYPNIALHDPKEFEKQPIGQSELATQDWTSCS